jgi:hypothetical protein
MPELTWMDYIMLILASYRLTHLIVFDKITEFIRNPFMKKKKIVHDNGEEEVKKVPKSMFGYLLNCYWCAGIWSAILIGFSYLLFPSITKVVVFILSIAGAQAILETFVGVGTKKIKYYSEQSKE